MENAGKRWRPKRTTAPKETCIDQLAHGQRTCRLWYRVWNHPCRESMRIRESRVIEMPISDVGTQRWHRCYHLAARLRGHGANSEPIDEMWR